MLKVSGIARLTRDPEIKQAGNSSVCKFGVVSSQKFKSKNGERKEKSAFFDIEAWGPQGQVIQNYFKKGDRIFVETELEQDSWTSPEGQKRTVLKGRLLNFEFIEKAQKSEDNDDSNSDSEPF